MICHFVIYHVLIVIFGCKGTTFFANMQEKEDFNANICIYKKKVVILRRILREYARVFMKRNGKIGFYY